MNDSIKGVVQGKCPQCGWERKVTSLTPPTATLFCKECDYQGASELWTTNAQAQVDRLNDPHPSSRAGATVTTRSSKTDNSTAILKKPSELRWLPGTFYGIAILGFIGWIIIALNLKSWQAGAYGFGSMIACLASGRLIELLQEINDELYTRRMSE